MAEIRKGDTVKIISGKEKGKTGKVLDVLREAGRVRVERHQLVKRHLKKGRTPGQPPGGKGFLARRHDDLATGQRDPAPRDLR